LSSKDIAKKVGSPITTVFSKIKRMEKMGIIKEYRAIVDPKKLGFSATAFILASVSYSINGEKVSQREIAKEIAKFPEVQEVHIITGDWDLLIKIRAENVDKMGKFVIDKLRLVKGIEKTLTCVVFETVKETTDVPIDLAETLFRE
ncbi:MAG: Lrp/AsnC family transcriptional regulator, partial [Thermoproteota archaeon]